MPIKQTSKPITSKSAFERSTPRVSLKTKFLAKAQFMSNAAYICVGLAIILFAAQIWLYGLRYQSLFGNDTTYSAVTLSNGQTYFGHLKKYSLGTFVLTDVYYLQQSATGTTADTTATTNTNTNTTADTTGQTNSGLQLVKLTNDIHKPMDFLVINRDNLIFWQQLQTDSPIISAIAKDKAGTTTTN